MAPYALRHRAPLLVLLLAHTAVTRVASQACVHAPDLAGGAAAPSSLTGIYSSFDTCVQAPRSVCTNVSSVCAHGCLTCADGTSVGLWHSSCAILDGITDGSLVTVTGGEKAYRGVDEFINCTAVQVLNRAPSKAPPPPWVAPIFEPPQCDTAPLGLGSAYDTMGNVTGVFLTRTHCALLCQRSSSDCSFGCLQCADNTVVGLYHSSCANLSASGLRSFSHVSIWGGLKTFSGLDEFHACLHFKVWSNALAPPAPHAFSPPAVCMTVPTLADNVTVAGNITAMFHPAGSRTCSTACASQPSVCELGCLSCNDGTVVGLYGNDCDDALAEGLDGTGLDAIPPGTVVNALGLVSKYNQHPEFKECFAITPYLSTEPSAAPSSNSEKKHQNAAGGCLSRRTAKGCSNAIAVLICFMVAIAGATCFATGVVCPRESPPVVFVLRHVANFSAGGSSAITQLLQPLHPQRGYRASNGGGVGLDEDAELLHGHEPL